MSPEIRHEGEGPARGERAGSAARRIAIPRAVLERIEAEARSAFPREACGLLLGTADGGLRTVRDSVALPNRIGDPTRGFRFDPLEYARAEESAAARGLAAVGIYHSHPNNRWGPSPTDVRQGVPGFSWVITAVASDRTCRTGSWNFDEKKCAFEAEEFGIVP